MVKTYYRVVGYGRSHDPVVAVRRAYSSRSNSRIYKKVILKALWAYSVGDNNGCPIY